MPKSKTLYVSGLDPALVEANLREEFSQHGRIERVTVIRDKITRVSKGFAYIVCGTEEDATAALKEMDGRVLMDKPIKVKFSHSETPEWLSVLENRGALKEESTPTQPRMSRGGRGGPMNRGGPGRGGPGRGGPGRGGASRGHHSDYAPRGFGPRGGGPGRGALRGTGRPGRGLVGHGRLGGMESRYTDGGPSLTRGGMQRGLSDVRRPSRGLHNGFGESYGNRMRELPPAAQDRIDRGYLGYESVDSEEYSQLGRGEYPLRRRATQYGAIPDKEYSTRYPAESLRSDLYANASYSRRDAGGYDGYYDAPSRQPPLGRSLHDQGSSYVPEGRYRERSPIRRTAYDDPYGSQADPYKSGLPPVRGVPPVRSDPYGVPPTQGELERRLDPYSLERRYPATYEDEMSYEKSTVRSYGRAPIAQPPRGYRL